MTLSPKAQIPKTEKRNRRAPRKTAASKPAPSKFDWGSQQLKTLHAFLKTHRQWNEAFQQREYRRCLLACASPRERLLHFMHMNVNTQRQADMNDLARFWALIATASDEQTSSPESLCALLETNCKLKRLEHWQGPSTPPTGSWDRLFWTLRRVPGWGEKTSALFINGCIRLHENGPDDLHFWDATKLEPTATGTSKLYLPVDAVIKKIFHHLGIERPEFMQINNGLHSAKWSAEEMLIWDDLWFWGFLTQTSKPPLKKGTTKTEAKPNNERLLVEWNDAKFWSNPSFPALGESEIKTRAKEFYELFH
jgi:hypothetical protein